MARPALTLDSRVTVSEDVLHQIVNDESVLLSLDLGHYYGLNAVGTRMWQLLIEHGKLRNVFDSMVEEYDVAPAELETDILGLAHQLQIRGLLKVHE